jgi:Zn-dependent protease/CBS domain-containing protein
MKAQVKLGRIFGVEIGLHYSWFIIAILITFSLASEFSQTNQDWSDGLRWSVALSTAVLFFVSIIVHELSHALVAKMRGLPVRSITLFALGGVAQIEKEAEDAKTEFWMGIIGPITSLVIGVICLAIALVLGWQPPGFPERSIPAMMMWLGYINISLAIFNMIPGFPLDGGRVLRGVIWWITGNANRSTRIAARVGQFIAFGFIVLGVMRFFGGAGFGGLWIAFIGWFLLNASRESYSQVAITEALRGVHVRDVFARDYPTVDINANLQTFVEESLVRTGRRCFVAVLNDQPEGIITLSDVRNVPQARWPYTTVADVMRPFDSVRTVTPDAPLDQALEVMAGQDLNQLPVVSNGKLMGMISRADVLQLLQTRIELRV